jgi:hypothetical protein
MTHQLIRDYRANVNYQGNKETPFLLEAVRDYFYDSDNDIRSGLTGLSSRSDCFIVAITTFLKYKGDVNIQHYKKRYTLLSLICDVGIKLKNDDE